MDCNDFASHWQALVAETLDDASKESMAAHARGCRDCGKQWDAHRELCTTIQSVLEDHRLAPKLADDIARNAYQERFGTALSAAEPLRGLTPGMSLKNPALPLLLAALLGGLAGYILAGSRSQSTLSQQMAYAQMLGATQGRGGVQQLMPYGLMGGNPVAGAGLFGQGLPQITNTVRVAFFILLLLWITRTKIWEAMFPSGLPRGIYVARWGAALATILGVGRCLGGIFMTLHLFGVMGSGGGQGAWQSFLLLSQSVGAVDQLWAFAFWLTLMLVLFTLANQMTLRFAQRARAADRS